MAQVGAGRKGLWLRTVSRALLLSAASPAICSVAFSQTAPAPAGAPGSDPQTVMVTDHRLTAGGLIGSTDAARAESAVSSDFVAQLAPTLTAFQLVTALPGANVATSDPYGISTASSLTLRGMGQDEIGVLMQGAPQNDIGNYYAYPSQFVDPENIRQVTLTPGSVDLDSPVINGAGGLLSVTLDDPAERYGGRTDLSYGSFDARRAFLRMDTGRIGNVRAFISYSRMGADNWRGPGRDSKQHVDFNLMDEWGQGNRISLSASFNDAVTTGYPEPTLAQWQQFGRSFNYNRDFQPGDTSYWRQYVNTFRNLYVSAPSTFTLTDHLSLDLTPYVQRGYGNSPYGATLSSAGNFFGTVPLAPLRFPGSANGTVSVLGNYTGDQFRAGLNGKLSWTVGHHTLIGGLWVDHADDRDQESFTPMTAGGEPVDFWGTDKYAIRMPDGRVYRVLDDHTITSIQSAYLADRISLDDDRLKIDLGFKAAYVSRTGTNGLPGPQYQVSLYDFQPLPRAAVRYQIDSRHQLFADVTTNFRSPNAYALYNTYSGGELTGIGNSRLKDEYSIAEEIGYRYRGGVMTASVTAFNYNFTNRQIATIVLVNGAQVNGTINAGGQTSRGIDAEIGLQPVAGFSPYLSGEFLDATTDNNISAGGDLVPTAGKTAVRSPRVQAAAGVSYDQGTVFGNLMGKYIGPQYSTFINDERMKGFGQLDAMIGYHLPSVGFALAPEVRLNLINVTNEKVLSGVASPTLNARTVTGVGGTAIAGTAPTYYIGGGFAAIATVASRF
ncbi:MAG: TonB-dependent receptor [Telmatospirillum sp.]|nr:TonB-dependent receptor [Telmatospirillum sp.]